MSRCPSSKPNRLSPRAPTACPRTSPRTTTRRWTSPLYPLHELFTAQAARTPDAVALVSGESELTYGELDGASDALAHRLIAAGVGPGAAVGLLFDRSLAYVVTVLAVLKSGGVYVPLDPRQRAERQTWILDNTDAVLLVSDRPAEETAAFAASLPTLRVSDASVTAYDPAPAPRVTVHPDQALYVMFTSGSTGTPKGVVNTHRNVVELALDPGFGAAAHERVLAYSPLAFDSSTYELWVPLLRGGTAVILSSPKIDIGELGEAVVRHDATAAYFTTALRRDGRMRRSEPWPGSGRSGPAATSCPRPP